MHDVMHAIVLYTTVYTVSLSVALTVIVHQECLSLHEPVSRLKKCETLCVSNNHTSAIHSRVLLLYDHKPG